MEGERERVRVVEVSVVVWSTGGSRRAPLLLLHLPPLPRTHLRWSSCRHRWPRRSSRPRPRLGVRERGACERSERGAHALAGASFPPSPLSPCRAKLTQKGGAPHGQPVRRGWHVTRREGDVGWRGRGRERGVRGERGSGGEGAPRGKRMSPLILSSARTLCPPGRGRARAHGGAHRASCVSVAGCAYAARSTRRRRAGETEKESVLQSSPFSRCLNLLRRGGALPLAPHPPARPTRHPPPRSPAPCCR